MQRRNKQRSRWKRRILIAGLSALVLASGGCILLWMMLASVPTWYRPPYVPEADYTRVRNAMVATVSNFGDRLVQGEPFDIVLTDAEISEWVIARSEIWPEAGEWLPPFIRGPMVSFQPGRVILAGRVDHDAWEAIANVHLRIDANPEHVTIYLDKVACGSCPIPIGLIADRLNPVLTARGQDPDFMPDAMADIVRFMREQGDVRRLTEGVAVPNRFYWQVSERWFRIGAISVEQGRVRLTIEPL